MTRTPRFRQTALVAATVALAAAACGAEGDQVADTKSAVAVESTTVPSGEASTTTTTDPPDGVATTDSTEAGSDDTPSSDPICQPGPGKTIEEIDDVEIPAVRVEDFESEDEIIGGQRIPGVKIEGFELPAQTVDGGCIVYHDAPGACFGKVEISDAGTIADESIPGAEMAPVVVDGETLFAGDVADSEQVSGEGQPGDVTEQVCRVTTNNRSLPAVSRPAISRPALSRPALSRPALSRPRICVDVADGQECADSVFVDSVFVDSVFMDSVFVDSEFMDSILLDEAPDTEVISGDEREAYVTPAEVLFDFDKADLKPAATPTLETIAAKLAELPEGTEIQIDGHTDDKGTDGYNDDLSQRRAEAVAEWLRTNGNIPADRISTTGYGESAPVEANDTEENRAKNRRVVISATTA